MLGYYVQLNSPSYTFTFSLPESVLNYEENGAKQDCGTERLDQETLQ